VQLVEGERDRVEEKPTKTLAAEDRIRETAQWLTVSLAFLGGVLVAGTQFSSLGSIQPGTDRFWAVVGGGAMAATGAAAILFGAVWTATSPPVSLASLKPGSWPNDTFLLELHKDVGALRDEYEIALARRNETIAAHLHRPTKQTERAAQEADDWTVHLAHIVQNVLTVASYQAVARRWRVAARVMAAGATVAFVGLMILIWGANPPAEGSAGTAAVGEALHADTPAIPEGQGPAGRELGGV
jgi:hypothetical protein